MDSPKAMCKEFTREEDLKMIKLIRKQQIKTKKVDWDEIANQLDHKSAKQCHDRFHFTICWQMMASAWTVEEDEELINLVEDYGYQWEMFEQIYKGKTGEDIRKRFSYLQAQRLYYFEKCRKNEIPQVKKIKQSKKFKRIVVPNTMNISRAGNNYVKENFEEPVQEIKVPMIERTTATENMERGKKDLTEMNEMSFTRMFNHYSVDEYLDSVDNNYAIPSLNTTVKII